MAFADDLLALAQDIADLPAVNRRQASVRRAVSTAYYALFHLLISEATLNWARPELRATLGRLFDHGPNSQERTVAEHLRTVVTTFIQAQQRRVDADYNLGKDVDETEMLTQLESVTRAFGSWKLIREEASAQAYLL